MFKTGERAIYTCPENPKFKTQFVAASMGGELVMHLNARDGNGRIKPITGTIGEAIPQTDGSVWYDFYPDGWACANASGWPKGFQVPESQLRHAHDDQVLPGTITDRSGRPI